MPESQKCLYPTPGYFTHKCILPCVFQLDFWARRPWPLLQFSIWLTTEYCSREYKVRFSLSSLPSRTSKVWAKAIYYFHHLLQYLTSSEPHWSSQPLECCIKTFVSTPIIICFIHIFLLLSNSHLKFFILLDKSLWLSCLSFFHVLVNHPSFLSICKAHKAET